MRRTHRPSQAGQVGVIIVLIMVGMLTAGLSIAVRTTQEVLLSGQEPDTARVFSAAEQGIEQALSSNLDFSGDSYSGSFETVQGVDVDFSIDKVNTMKTRMFEGVAVGVDVTGVENGNELRIDWSKKDDCDSEAVASIIASVYFDVSGSTRVRHLALGSCDYGDGFELATSIDQDGYKRRYDLPLQTGDFLVRIRPVYNDTYVNVSSVGFTLPTQYYSIRSEAANQTGEEVRVVEVNRTISSAPSIFDYALYSGADIRK